MGIQEVVNSIANVETEADEIVRRSVLKASDMQMQAENSAALAVSDAKIEAKTYKKNAIAQAEKNLKTIVEEQINKGAEDGALTLKNAKKNIDKAVEFLKGRLVEQYVNR